MIRLVSPIRNFSHKKYDLITIGPYANRIARRVSQLLSRQYSILTIQQSNVIYEPSFFPFRSPYFKVNQKNFQFSDVQIGVGVKQINAHKSEITLKNGSIYGYRQLIYSDNSQQWRKQPEKDPNVGKNPHFHDKRCQQMKSLFNRKNGKIVFIIPKGLHFAYDSIFALLLKTDMEGDRKDSSELDITVVCQQQQICPQSKEFSSIIENILKDRNIKIIKGASHVVDYQKQRITFSYPHPRMQFTQIYEYLPVNPPNLLNESNINPFELDEETFTHKKYSNLHIVANLSKNSIFSISARQAISNTISKNVYHNLIGVKKRSIYNGQSSTWFWINRNQCIYFRFKNNSLINYLGQSAICRYILAIFRKAIITYGQPEALNNKLKKERQALLLSSLFNSVSRVQKK